MRLSNIIVANNVAADRGRTRSALTIGFLLLSTQAPALFPIAKFFPAPSLSGPVFLLLVLLGILLILNPPRVVSDLMVGAWPSLLVAAAMTLAALTIYPYADGLKLQGRGSDGDDALILAGKALWAIHNPYLELTYLENPICPGPGWVFIAAPFSVTGLYLAFFPATLAAAIACLRRSGLGWPTINRLVLLMASSLSVWHQVVVGSDYLAFTLLMLCTTLGLHRVSIGSIALSALVVLVGLLSTFRLPFLILPPLIAVGLWRSFPSRAITVACGGLALALVLHAIFYMLSPTYPPLDVILEKLADVFSLEGLAVVAAICAGTGLIMARYVRSWHWPMQFAVGLGIPWGLVSAAGLAWQGGNLADWDFANFLIWPMPFAILAVIAPRS